MELLLTFLCGALLLWLNRAIFAHLIHPAQRGMLPVYAVVPAQGDGDGLEQTLRHLTWLRREKLARFTVLVVDAGLTPLGRDTVTALQCQDASLLSCTLGEADLLFKRKDDYDCCSL